MNELFYDQYTNINLIHENNKSLIYKAIDKKNDRAVIIKSLSLKHPSEKDIHIFTMGYHLVHKLSNPNLIQMYDLKLGYKQAAYVMEDIDGVSLDNILTRHPLTLDEVLPISIALLDNLKHIHNGGLVHQDLNPSNIIWNSETGQVRIIDFEMAVSHLEHRNYFQEPERITGSLPYMSPEQTGKINHSIDYRSDFYSFGVTLYELLTLSKPFISDDIQELIYCHIAKPPQHPTDINPDIHDVVSEIVLKLMAKMPEDRYQSHSGLMHDLSKCQKELSRKGTVNHFPIGAKDISGNFTISKKLYGRKKDIEKIHNLLQDSPDKKHLICLFGDEGSGKTRLIKAVQRYATEIKLNNILSDCRKNRQKTPYSVWISAINDLINQWLAEGKQKVNQMKSLILLYLESNSGVITNLIPNLELIIGHQEQTFIPGYIEHHNLFNHMFCKFLKAVSQEKELLIMFDDVQWMDPSSIKLLMTILQHKPFSNLNVLLSFKNIQLKNQFIKHHDITRLSDLSIAQIKIDNLSSSDIYELVFNSFHLTRDSCQKFSQLLHEKTGGNISFVHQMLNSFYQKELLFFYTDSLQWQININQIKQCEIADNLVDLTIDQYNHLSIDTQLLLKTASCIGHTVDKKLLSRLMCLSDSELNKAHSKLMKLSFILSGDHCFHFSHRRIQKSIYELIPDEKRYYIHRDIARLIYQDFQLKKDKDKYFDILTHYNQALPIIQTDEKIQLIELNKNAGILAINKGAYDLAIQYLSIALTIANDIPYDLDRQLIETLYENRAKAFIILSEYTKAERDVDILINKTKCMKDKGRFFELALKIYIMTNQFEKGLLIGLDYLRNAGLNIPEELTLNYANKLLKETDNLIANNIDNLFYNFPWMTDEIKQKAAIILCRLMSFFYFFKPELISITPCLSIHLYHKQGLFITTPASLTTYAAIQCSPTIQNYPLGFRLAEIAENLCYQKNNKQFLPYVIKVRYGFVSCWQHDSYYCMEKLKEGVRVSLDVGDNEMASYCYYNQAMFIFSSGINLNDGMILCKDIVNNLEMLGHEEILNPVRHMLTMLEHFSSTSGQIEQNDKLNNRIPSSSGYQVLLMELIHHYYFHQYETACHYAREGMKLFNTISTSSYITTWLAFYGALAFLKKEQKELRYDESFKYIDLMESYYKKLPGLLDSKYYIVKALESYVKGESHTAIDYYEKAIFTARQKKLIHDEALAHELASELFFSQGKINTAELYIEAAIKLYKEWGACGIVQLIEHRYPQFKKLKDTSVTDTFSLLKVSDYKTILEASKIMNQMTKSDRPFYNALQLLVKISGAQKGLLFLKKHQIWELAETIKIDSSKKNVRKTLSDKKYASEYPISIINYVSLSKNKLIFTNDSNNDYQHQDPYIIQRKIQSFACLPLITKEKVCGVVYLENKFIPNLFTKKVNKLLEIVLAQFSLFVENQLFKHQLSSKNYEQKKEIDYYVLEKNISNDMAKDANTYSSQLDLDMLNERHYTFFSEIIQPQLSLLKEKNFPAKLRKKIVNNIEKEMKNISDSFISKIERFKLTPTEKKVVFLLKQNFLSKEVADILNISIETINTHRKKIRKKLNLTNKSKNLVSYIKSMN